MPIPYFWPFERFFSDDFLESQCLYYTPIVKKKYESLYIFIQVFDCLYLIRWPKHGKSSILIVLFRWHVLIELCKETFIKSIHSREHPILALIVRMLHIVTHMKGKLFEPPHGKTNKLTVHPSKTQISLGICPVWSESSLSPWRKLGSLATH